MVLYLIGLGLGESEDLTLHGITCINSCPTLYLLQSRFYSSNQKCLEKYFSREITTIAPHDLEATISELACKELSKDTALLMPGNPFCENLYPMLKYQCYQYSIPLKVIHNASYLNAMGNTGLQLYKFGETVFVDSFDDNHLASYFEVVNSNLQRSLNTLFIFCKESNTNLGHELIAAICRIDEETCLKNELSPSSKLVLVRGRNKRRIFDYGTAKDMYERSSSNEIEALTVCFEWDCVEEEFLREVSQYDHRNDTHREPTVSSETSKGDFHLVGLGLGKPEDITLRGRTMIEKSEKVFLEGYTSIMLGGKDELERFFKKEIVVADREMVEQNSDEILSYLTEGLNVAFLVVGDPFGATTHADIFLRATLKAENVVIANNASILNATGLSGLKPRRFGSTVSIPFWSGSYQPDSFYDKIAANYLAGQHTLCLLDIQVKEQSFENLARGRKIYEKPRYMTTSVAAQQLLESKRKRLLDEKRSTSSVPIGENTNTISLTRIDTDTESVTLSTLGDLPQLDEGPPLHSLVVIGSLDENEKDVINLLKTWSFVFVIS